MRQRILNHGSFLVILSVLLTFLAASFVMYDKFDVFMKQSVRDEVEYIRAGIEAAGLDYLESNVKEINATRITVTDNEAMFCMIRRQRRISWKIMGNARSL